MVFLFIALFLVRRNHAPTTTSHTNVVQSPRGAPGPGGRERGEVLGPLVVAAAGVLHQRVRVTVLLHALGAVVELLVHEPARLPQDVGVAGELVEALPVVAVPVQLDVLVVLVLPALGLDHLEDRRTAVHAAAVPALLS